MYYYINFDLKWKLQFIHRMYTLNKIKTIEIERKPKELKKEIYINKRISY